MKNVIPVPVLRPGWSWIYTQTGRLSCDTKVPLILGYLLGSLVLPGMGDGVGKPGSPISESMGRDTADDYCTMVVLVLSHCP